MQLLKYAASTYTILSTALTPPSRNSQILDPIVTIFKLCVLSFKIVGTKVSISNNKIAFQVPNYIQGVSRWSHGDRRDDLHNLHIPLKNFIRFGRKEFDEEDLEFIIKLAVEGLSILKEAYRESSIVSHSINHYINLINQSLIIEDDDDDNDENIIYNELKSIWTKRQLDIVCNIFREIKERYDSRNDSNKFVGDDYNYYLHSVENILYSKDIIVEELIRRITSGY